MIDCLYDNSLHSRFAGCLPLELLSQQQSPGRCLRLKITFINLLCNVRRKLTWTSGQSLQKREIGPFSFVSTLLPRVKMRLDCGLEASDRRAGSLEGAQTPHHFMELIQLSWIVCFCISLCNQTTLELMNAWEAI